MVDALADDPEAAVAAALAWCEQINALPRRAMLGNRAMMRAAMCAQFDALVASDVEQFVRGWFEDSTQRVLHELVATLKARA
jgi:hypothetical protein